MLFSLRFGIFLDTASPAYFTGYERFRNSGMMADSTDFPVVNLVALDDDKIVGGIAICRNGSMLLGDRAEFAIDDLESRFGFEIRDAEVIAEFQRGFVLPSHRGRGVFRLLLDAADAEFRTTGGKVAFGASKSGNTSIHEALTRHGWIHYTTYTGGRTSFDYLAKGLV